MVDWDQRDSWVGVFDILGFKNLIHQADHQILRTLLIDKLDELIRSLDSPPVEHGQLKYLIFSDTFVIFAPNFQSYGWFLHACENLIDKSIYIELPLRGAISTGPTFTSTDPPIVLGPAFVEAHEYCEDQDWIGLLLTPSAISELRKKSLEPLRHDFVSDEQIPLRMKSSTEVVAYRFQNGSANFDGPFLSHLHQMKHLAPKWQQKEKYERTIAFIQRHYRHDEKT